jgi:ABC-type branched-subunit amino acid transport system ATPase component
VVAPDVVNLAVAATIGTNKATVQARAQKIKDIASSILVDEGALTSLPTLAADVNAQIAKLNLPGPDLILAQQLAAALEIAANVYLTGSGKTAPVASASVAIQTVLNQVIAEAVAFGAV